MDAKSEIVGMGSEAHAVFRKNYGMQPRFGQQTKAWNVTTGVKFCNRTSVVKVQDSATVQFSSWFLLLCFSIFLNFIVFLYVRMHLMSTGRSITKTFLIWNLEGKTTSSSPATLPIWLVCRDLPGGQLIWTLKKDTEHPYIFFLFFENKLHYFYIFSCFWAIIAVHRKTSDGKLGPASARKPGTSAMGTLPEGAVCGCQLYESFRRLLNHFNTHFFYQLLRVHRV